VLALAALLLATAPAGARTATPFDGPPAGAPQAHAAFKLAGWQWRSGRITYYNAARRSRWAVRQAVRAWNASGAKVRFVAASRARARLLIRYHPARGCLPYAYAQPLYDSSRRVARAQVVIPRPHPRNSFCSRWGHALVVTHELGHVLGLGHETRRCATMNPETTGLAPGRCPLQPEWRWHCGLLEADDVRGAVRLYGGRVDPRPPRLCDLVGPPAPVTDLTAAAAGDNAVDVAFIRPSKTVLPEHVRPTELETFAVAMAPGACPARSPLGSPWSVAVGARQLTQLTAQAPGSHCVSVWARDATGRLSAPVTVPVEVS
jgi:hypothetical protein